MAFRVLKDGEIVDDGYGVKATIISGIGHSKDEKNSSYFGCVLDGYLQCDKQDTFKKGEFFAGQFKRFISNFTETKICLIEVENFNSPYLKGEIEPCGRLKYIDGAYNSLLMSPPKKGDPCLNALYMKGKIDQTPHTHPSTRVGAILRGGVTVRIWDSEGAGANVLQEIILMKGDVWFMDRDTVHSFHTKGLDDMALFAFHPDSDFGPTDEEAPMINRTMIEGKSAKGNNEPKKTKDLSDLTKNISQ